jgi:hypothetical protein
MRPLISFSKRVKHYTCGSTDQEEVFDKAQRPMPQEWRFAIPIRLGAYALALEVLHHDHLVEVAGGWPSADLTASGR